FISKLLAPQAYRCVFLGLSTSILNNPPKGCVEAVPLVLIFWSIYLLQKMFLRTHFVSCYIIY
ncbi:hypothetical protein, partial [Labilibaculum manganireducens]|uniref:hypothetical protein n=1 Tax=Labilibaculum manganireducens TaxID=1940525 RepID=UPI001C5724EB